MPWVTQEHLDWLRNRIDALEVALASERAENRRREDHIFNMALRRAQTFPVEPREAAKLPELSLTPISRFSPDDVGKAQAIRDEGLRLIANGATYTEADIEREVKAATGMTLADLRAAEIQIAEESQSVS